MSDGLVPSANQNSPSVSPSMQTTDDRASASVAPTLVSTMAQAQPVITQVEPQTSARSKEIGSLAAQESLPKVEVGGAGSGIEQEPIPEAVEAWMEKVGEEETSVNLENLPAVQVPPPAPKISTPTTIFVLPLGQEEMKLGLHASVNDSIRWLATWATRLIKQLKGKTAFKDQGQDLPAGRQV